MKISIIISLLILGFIQVCSAENKNLEFTYSYWNEDKQIAENLQIFSRLVSNDNRFYTTSFKKVDCNLERCDQEEGVDMIKIASNEPLHAEISEVIPESVEISKLMVSIFQKFVNKFFNNLAIKSTHFDKSSFSELPDLYEILEPSDFSAKLAEKSKYIHILYVRKTDFDNFEAIIHFIDALKRTKLIGALVDCEKLSEICDFQNIHSFPTLLAYRNEEIYKKFDLKFEEDQVHDWILTIEQPYITKLSEDAVPYYRSGIVPGFYEARDTVSMLFTPTKNSVVYQNFAKFAKLNHGKYHLTAMVSKEVEKWAHQPAFITMKPRDEYIKAFTLYNDITYDRMVEFFEEGAHPSVHEITSARQFQYSLSTSKPLIIFFDPLKSKNSTNFRKFASDQQGMLNRDAFYSVIEGLEIFGIYLMDVLKAPMESYISVTKTENGYCISSKPIKNENEFYWIPKLLKKCDYEIEDILLPISRLEYLERIEDAENLLRELQTKSSHDEL